MKGVCTGEKGSVSMGTYRPSLKQGPGGKNGESGAIGRVQAERGGRVNQMA